MYKLIWYLKDGIFFDKLMEFILRIRVNSDVSQKYAEEKCYRYIKRKYGKKIVTNEKKVKSNYDYTIWICWWQGEENAPLLVKRCIESVRMCKSHRVIIINQHNYKEYIQFPQYIEDKIKKNLIPMAHLSDLVRIELLCQYGGVWMDATVFCTDAKFIENMSKLPLFVFKQVNLNRNTHNPIVASSWYISCVANNPILEYTRKLLHLYWMNHSYLLNYFLFHICFTLATEKYQNEWNEIPVYNNVSPHIMQFELLDLFDEERYNLIVKGSDIHKLNWKLNKNQYVANTMLNELIGDIEEKYE